MPSVLGKRTRSTTNTTADTVFTRSKRRVVLNEPSDENENPFVSHPVSEDVGTVRLEVLEPAEPVKKTRTRAARTVPVKHGAPGRRVEVPSATINAQFKVSKVGVDVYHDSKSEPKPSPHTPRHRDALSKKVLVTTPRHRVLLAGGQLTPRTPATPSNAATAVYNEARQLFSRCANPGRLVGRDTERQELASFVQRSLDSTATGGLYVSGPPGTGKSALVDEVCQEHRDAKHLKLSVVNCMSVRSAKDLSEKLAEDLGLEEVGFAHLESCFVRSKASDGRKYLVILDEVDRLVDLDLDLLYNLFEWSMHSSSRLILIGIANALDLTDRCLPRLKARDLKPELLPFMPYTATQIAEVLASKLKSLSPSNPQTVPFLYPAAMQFCAKKVASQTGDLRKAFDICRRAIDLVEQETRERDAEKALQDSPSKTPLMDNINLSSPGTPRSPVKTSRQQPTTYTLDTAPKATIAHMAKVTAQVFGNGTAQRLSTLNLQQKAVLCALAALEKRKRETQVERSIFSTPSKHSHAAPSVKQLFEAYSSLCKREKLLHPLSSVEFRDVVEGLETLSLVTAADGKAGSFGVPMTPSRTPSRRGKGFGGAAAMGDEKRVASVVGYKELQAALEGAGGELLREMLGGDVLL